MVEKSKKQKTNFVSEDDISTLLQRYTATTVLALLQEVAQVQDVKIDWNALVKKTATGISNAREYQMLWRHLAYRDVLLDRLNDTAQPLDDDSDLENDLEAFPAVSNEASAEAAACVKVMIASGVSNDPNGSTVEAPLTINIPKGQMSKALENSHFTTNTQGMNITFPISVQKQPLPTHSHAEALDSNGAASANLPRRKRKPWSAAEDKELIDAVKKCGEGNWANILKGDFKGDRTASQLSQRWAIIRKKHGNVNVGAGSQLSEAQLATRQAISQALDYPMGHNLKTSCSIASGANSDVALSNLGRRAGNETSAVVTQSLPPAQHDSVQTTAPSGPSKARTAKKPLTKSTLSPDSMVKAAAVAAGARIASPSDAASLLKAAQSKNAVHIMPGGSLIKPSTSGNTNSLSNHVHFIRTGLASKSHSSYSTAPENAPQPVVTQQVQGPCIKPAAPVIQSNTAINGTDLSASADVVNATLSIHISRADVKSAEDDATCSFGNTRKEIVEEDQAGTPCKVSIEELGTDKNSFSGAAPMDQDAPGSSFKDQVEGGQAYEDEPMKEQVGGDELSASANGTTKQVQENRNDSTISGLGAGNDDFGPIIDNHSACEEIHVNERKNCLISMANGK